MTINDYVNLNHDKLFRIIQYIPAPDILDNDGNFICGGEGESIVVFDNTTGKHDIPFDIMRCDITTINTGDDNIPEVEYIPDEYYVSF